MSIWERAISATTCWADKVFPLHGLHDWSIMAHTPTRLSPKLGVLALVVLALSLTVTPVAAQ